MIEEDDTFSHFYKMENDTLFKLKKILSSIGFPSDFIFHKVYLLLRSNGFTIQGLDELFPQEKIIEKKIFTIDRYKLNESIISRKGYSLEELKGFCREFQLKISGTKAELVARLKEYWKWN